MQGLANLDVKSFNRLTDLPQENKRLIVASSNSRFILSTVKRYREN